MDIERTMEFILQQQAKAEAEMAAMRQQQAEMLKRQAKAEERQAKAEAKAERQMAAIRKLIQVGMRMIVKNEELIKEVASAQKVTETKLQGLIDAWRRNGNGHRPKR